MRVDTEKARVKWGTVFLMQARVANWTRKTIYRHVKQEINFD